MPPAPDSARLDESEPVIQRRYAALRLIDAGRISLGSRYLLRAATVDLTQAADMLEEIGHPRDTFAVKTLRAVTYERAAELHADGGLDNDDLERLFSRLDNITYQTRRELSQLPPTPDVDGDPVGESLHADAAALEAQRLAAAARPHPTPGTRGQAPAGRTAVSSPARHPPRRSPGLGR